MARNQSDLTLKLRSAASGDEHAAEELWQMVYAELRLIAHRELKQDRLDHTMSTTALVHEAYMKMVDLQDAGFNGRAHFFGVACKAMRHILVDYARQRNAYKRKAQKEAVSLDHANEAVAVGARIEDDLETLNDGLEHLELLDPTLSQVVECRFFGGLSREETAEVMGTSVRTVDRHWKRARAYLYDFMANQKGLKKPDDESGPDKA